MVPPGVLYIKATKLSDAGSYRFAYISLHRLICKIELIICKMYISISRCIVNNEFLKKTKKSKEAKLTVTSRPEGNGSHTPPLLFPQVSYNHWLLNGTSLSLACAASGYPSPLMTWTFIPRYTGNLFASTFSKIFTIPKNRLYNLYLSISDTQNVAQPRILPNSSIGINILSLANVSVSDAGVYLCSTKTVDTNNLEIQVRRGSYIPAAAIILTIITVV